MIARLYLAFTALTFAAFGLWSLFDPAGMTAQLQVSVSGVSGIFEMRGIYGGVSLGAATLCLLGANSTKFRFAGLCFVAAYMGGYVIGRAASLAMGDSAATSNWGFAIFEAVMCVLAILLLRRQT